MPDSTPSTTESLSDSMTDTFEQELVTLIPGLRRFALSLTQSESDRDDLVQTALERAMERRHQRQNTHSLKGWVYSILHSIWKNELRSRAVRRGNGLVDAASLCDPSGSQPTHNSVEQQQLFAQVREQVLHLPEAQRAVIMLVDVEGLSYHDAAHALDVPKGTIMSRLSRARATLIKQLRPGNLS